MHENSPEYDPQANENAEVGVKLVKGMVRTMRPGFERELGLRIPAKYPLIAWLVRHAANTLTWAVKGQDGKTVYHRVRGKAFRTRLMTFGEQCRDHRSLSAPPVTVEASTLGPMLVWTVVQGSIWSTVVTASNMLAR